jgi:hypothetical protein
MKRAPFARTTIQAIVVGFLWLSAVRARSLTAIPSGRVPALTPCRDAVSKSGPVSYRPPRDWQRGREADTELYLPPDLPKGELCFLTVPPDKALKGTFREWFKAETAACLKAARVLDKTEIAEQKTADGRPGLYIAVEIKTREKQRLYGFLSAVQHGQRGFLFGYFATSPKLIARYQPTLNAFCRSITFEN